MLETIIAYIFVIICIAAGGLVGYSVGYVAGRLIEGAINHFRKEKTNV